jgi:hypothetical protein
VGRSAEGACAERREIEEKRKVEGESEVRGKNKRET